MARRSMALQFAIHLRASKTDHAHGLRKFALRRPVFDNLIPLRLVRFWRGGAGWRRVPIYAPN